MNKKVIPFRHYRFVKHKVDIPLDSQDIDFLITTLDWLQQEIPQDLLPDLHLILEALIESLYHKGFLFLEDDHFSIHPLGVDLLLYGIIFWRDRYVGIAQDKKVAEKYINRLVPYISMYKEEIIQFETLPIEVRIRILKDFQAMSYGEALESHQHN